MILKTLSRILKQLSNKIMYWMVGQTTNDGHLTNIAICSRDLENLKKCFIDWIEAFNLLEL